MASLLRHAGLAQTGCYRGVEQRANFRHLPTTKCLHVGEARKTVVSSQPVGCGEFGGCAFMLAMQGIGGSEGNARPRVCRSMVTCLFEPHDRFVYARFQQMYLADRLPPNAKLRITWAEPDGPFHEWDRLFDMSRVELALAECEKCVYRVAIGGEHCLVFGNGFLESPLCAKNLA